ncbi:hypothetical protein C0991_002308, partial [Blastosporella zonata]
STGDTVETSAPLEPHVVGIHAHPDPTDFKAMKCYWSLRPESSNTDHQIAIAVEVKDDWREMIEQSATYARAQWRGAAHRAFSLVIGVHHKENKLRFLIFHSGGLTASQPLSLKDETGKLLIQKILFSIYSWQSPEDAGFPSFTDGCSFHLGNDKDTSLEWKVEEIYHHALSVRGRKTWVARLAVTTNNEVADDNHLTADRGPATVNTVGHGSKSKAAPQDATKGDNINSALGRLAISGTKQNPGNPSSEPLVEDAEPIYQRRYHQHGCEFIQHRILFLKSGKGPKRGEKCTIKLSNPSEAKRTLEAEVYAASRGAFGTPSTLLAFEAVTKDGSTLSNAIFLPSPNDTQKSANLLGLTHGTLDAGAAERRSFCGIMSSDEGQSLEECDTPWDLSVCLLHGMLGWLSYYQAGYFHRDVSIGNILKLKKPASREAFRVSTDKILAPLTELADTQPYKDLQTSADTLKSQIQKIRDWGENEGSVEVQDCKAILTDCDMAAEVIGYFSKEHDGSISGTPEFMSIEARLALECGRAYVQSPIDDMESFYWTAVWATLNNAKFPSTTEREEEWKRCFDDSGASARIMVKYGINTLVSFDLPDRECSPFLAVMAPMLQKWWELLWKTNIQWSLAWKPVKAGPPLPKELLFHQFAYKLIPMYVVLLEGEKEGLQGFSRPEVAA